jgi:hypothetical protein
MMHYEAVNVLKCLCNNATSCRCYPYVAALCNLSPYAAHQLLLNGPNSAVISPLEHDPFGLPVPARSMKKQYES